MQELESAASWYQELLVPALFEKWTDQVLHESRLKTTNRLLDVACQFDLMFFKDRQMALQEMFRVLKSKGRLVVTVFNSLDYIPGYERITKVFAAVAGEEVAEILRFPFSFGDTEELKSLCSTSGITSAKVITHKEDTYFPDVRAMVLADVNGWFPLAGITLDEKQIDEVVSWAEIELKEFIAADRSVTFPMSAHFIVATKN